MDYITHNLFGVAMYGAQNKTGLSRKTKIALFAASVGSNVIPDIDVQWADRANGTYLLLHRGITHSLLMAPVWAALFYGACWLILRVKDKRIFYASLAGVLLHIVSDWTNAWGTGLFTPFTERKFASGFIPNKGYVFWVIALAALVLLAVWYRRQEKWIWAFRAFWMLAALYVAAQGAQAAWIYADLKSQGYANVTFRADRWPGGMSYFAKDGGAIVEGRQDWVRGNNGIVRSYRIDSVDLDALKQNGRARTILLFAPFAGTQVTGDGIRLFDPRFAGRLGMLDIVIPNSELGE